MVAHQRDASTKATGTAVTAVTATVITMSWTRARQAAQVQATRARIDDKQAARAEFDRNRRHGLQHRHAARATRLGGGPRLLVALF